MANGAEVNTGDANAGGYEEKIIDDAHRECAVVGIRSC